MGKANRKKPPSSRPARPNLKQKSMSGALIDLVAPLYDAQDMPLKQYHALVGFGAIAWTVAQFPKEQRKERLLAAGREWQVPRDRRLPAAARAIERPSRRMSGRILILGARSGKSRHAESLALQSGLPVV